MTSLATMIDARIRALGGHQTCQEFGTIRAGLALEPDSMQGTLIPSDLYVLAKHLRAGHQTEAGGADSHVHALPDLAEGDRVVFLWVGRTPFVVGVFGP